ncbi:MAG TPA: HPP family protein [Ktedonobacterales bacterium]|nr:HPP family protein [Ktedonobacterales bacterium]
MPDHDDPTAAPPRPKTNNTTPPGRWSYRFDREHPIGGQMSDIVRGLIVRVQLPWLLARHSRVPVLAIFSFLNGLLSIGLMSLLALITGSPFIFPSLGPTAFLFFYTPTAPTASPRNTIIGHLIGVLAGYFALLVTGLTNAGPALSVGVTWPRVIAAALSLGLTAGLMVLLKSPHPPAGATTLIISLGLLTAPYKLVILMLAVVLLTVQAFAINRAAGIPYPIWNPIRETPTSPRPAVSDRTRAP